MAAPAEIPAPPASDSETAPAKRARVPVDPDVVITRENRAEKYWDFTAAVGRNPFWNLRVCDKTEGAVAQRPVFGPVEPRQVTVVTDEFDPKFLSITLFLDLDNPKHVAFIELVDTAARSHVDRLTGANLTPEQHAAAMEAGTLDKRYFYRSIAQDSEINNMKKVTLRAPEKLRKVMMERAALRDGRWLVRVAYISTYNDHAAGTIRVDTRLEVPDLTVLRSFDPARPAAARIPRGEDGKAAIEAMQAKLSTRIEF